MREIEKKGKFVEGRGESGSVVERLTEKRERIREEKVWEKGFKRRERERVLSFFL